MATATSPSDPTSPQSWNRYQYVLADPINLFDPTGLCGDVPDIAVWHGNSVTVTSSAPCIIPINMPQPAHITAAQIALDWADTHPPSQVQLLHQCYADAKRLLANDRRVLEKWIDEDSKPLWGIFSGASKGAIGTALELTGDEAFFEGLGLAAISTAKQIAFASTVGGVIGTGAAVIALPVLNPILKEAALAAFDMLAAEEQTLLQNMCDFTFRN